MHMLWSTFKTKDQAASDALGQIFEELKDKTPTENGNICYDIFLDSDRLIYFVLETWNTELDAIRHEESLRDAGILNRAAAMLLEPIASYKLRKL